VVATSTAAGTTDAAHDLVWQAGAASPRTRRGVLGRFSSGHLVMVVAGLVAAVLGFAVLRHEPSGVLVAVAAHDLRAGESVTSDDFRMARIDAPSDVLDTLLRPRDVRAVKGRVTTASVAAGDLVVRTQLHQRAAPGGLRAMSLPIDAALAVAGRLEPGDRVDVLFAGASSASIIVPDALVLAVDARARGGIGESSSPFTVTLAVTAQQTQLLAAAIADGDVSIARTTGARAAAGTTPLPLDRVGGGAGR